MLRALVTKGHVVHDAITHREEDTSRERLGKEIGHIICGGNIGHADKTFLDSLPDIEVTPIDMLHPSMMLRVVANGDSRLIICPRSVCRCRRSCRSCAESFCARVERPSMRVRRGVVVRSVATTLSLEGGSTLERDESVKRSDETALRKGSCKRAAGTRSRRAHARRTY